MLFIYELRYNDKPFYVGISGFPKFRYTQHLYGTLGRAHLFVRYMIYNFDLYPSIRIVKCSKNWIEGDRLEKEQIKLRLDQGYTLLNTQWVKMPSIVMKGKYIPKYIFETLRQDELNIINEYEANNRL